MAESGSRNPTVRKGALNPHAPSLTVGFLLPAGLVPVTLGEFLVVPVPGDEALEYLTHHD
jgi:hypothetical protein